MTTILAFLGSAGLRLFLGHLFDVLTRWQEQRNELARLRLQAEIDAAQHVRQMEAVRLQADLQVKSIQVGAAAHVTMAEADAFVEAVKATRTPTGIRWVDAWNGIIRPLLATIAIWIWVQSMYQRNWVLDEWDKALMASILGVFVGGRIAATGR